MPYVCKLNAYTFRNIADLADALPDEYPCTPPVNPILNPDGTVREKNAQELQADADAEAAKDAEKAQGVLDKQEFLAKRQLILDDMIAIVARQQLVIDTPPTTNAGRDSAILDLARDVKKLANNVKLLTNAVKGLL